MQTFSQRRLDKLGKILRKFISRTMQKSGLLKINPQGLYKKKIECLRNIFLKYF